MLHHTWQNSKHKQLFDTDLGSNFLKVTPESRTVENDSLGIQRGNKDFSYPRKQLKKQNQAKRNEETYGLGNTLQTYIQDRIKTHAINSMKA